MKTEKTGIIAVALEGNFLLEVFRIIKNGKFTEIDSSFSQKEGEVQIGTMNDFEKALYTFLAESIQEIRKSIALIEKDESKDSKEERDKVFKMRNDIEMAKNLLWNSIETRSRFSHGEIGIRPGFKIVGLKKSRKCNFPTFLIIETEEPPDALNEAYVESNSKYKH